VGRADAQLGHPAGPVWLVGHPGSQDLGRAGPGGGRGDARAAVVDDGGHPAEQRLVVDFADGEAVVAVAGQGRIVLTTAALIGPYRGNGALLAKQLATVDSIAGGRLRVGIAVGARADDCQATGSSPWRVRCLEIRGHADAVTKPTDSAYDAATGGSTGRSSVSIPSALSASASATSIATPTSSRSTPATSADTSDRGPGPGARPALSPADPTRRAGSPQRGSNPPATCGEQAGGTVAEIEQRPGDLRGRLPAYEPTGDGEWALQRIARAECEGFAAQKQAEASRHSGE
jgi:hypothetical protein